MAKIFTLGVSSVITVVQFASMAFLIICCITAPVFKQIGLSKTDGVVFGTFGYCENGQCSTAQASYYPEQLASNASWNMNFQARTTLGKILIIMPVAAGLTFFSMIGNFTAQFGSVGARGATFIINLLLCIIAFAGSALMCVVTFLLFYPHMTWCSWLLIPAAAINLVCVPLTYVAHSMAPASDDDESIESDVGYHQEMTAFKQPSSRAESINGYYDGHAGLEKPAYPDFYKGPDVVTSTTSNSGTTDSRAGREKPISELQIAHPVIKTAYGTAEVVRPSGDNTENDFSFDTEARAAQPYSAIAGPQSEESASLEPGTHSSFVAPSRKYREQSTTSSFYSEADNRVSRRDTLDTADLRPTSALNLEADTKKEKSGNDDALQRIIDGAIHEDDEEFIKLQTIDPSERPLLDDDDGIKDDDSDFTSVSQRGINPNYMPLNTGPALQQNRSIHPPISRPGARTTNYPSVPLGRTFPPEQGHNSHHLQRGYANFENGPVRQRMHPHKPYGGGQMASQQKSLHPSYSQGRSNASFPSYSNYTTSELPPVGARATQRSQVDMHTAPLQAPPSSNYRPAYKKRLPRQNVLPAASLARDGPYAGMI